MMRNVFIAALLMVVPFNLMAQNDDMYFVPSKKAKQEAREKAQQERDSRFVTVIYEPEDDYMAQEDQPDFHTGALRDVDEYNRRGHNHPSSFGEIRVGNDTLYITEEQLAAEDSIRNSSRSKYRNPEEEEYNYSGRLVRFHGGVRSPYYWDYYYDWAYDPFFYDPFYYNSWYYGPGYYGWYGPYNSAWYRHGWYGWYDPWYDYAWGWGGYYGSYYYGGYYGGYYGPGWGHIGHGGGWYDRPLARRSEAARMGGRRSSAGISASRGNGISASRASRSGSVAGTRGQGSISVNEPRSGGINSMMRRDGLNTSTRGTRDLYVNGSTTRSQQNTSRVQTNTRTNNNQGISSQRAARQENTYTPPTTTTRSATTSSFSSGSSMGGSRGGGSIGGGSIGGGSRGGGSGRGGR